MRRPGVTQHSKLRWSWHLWSWHTGMSYHHMFPKLNLQLLFKEGWSCVLIQVHCWWLASMGQHWSPLQSHTDLEHLHTHGPPLGTFHPWSCMDILVDIHQGACSFLLIHPRGVLIAWCRAVPDNLLNVTIPQSHSLLDFVHLGWNWYILPM